MKAKEFVKLFEDKFIVKGYQYEDESKVNEKNFTFKLQYKEYDAFAISDDSIRIVWTSQGWPSKEADFDKFYDEITRFAKYWANKCNLEEQVTIDIKLFGREIGQKYKKILI